MVKFLDGGTIIIREFNLTSSEQVCLTAVGDICLGTGVKKYLKEKGSIFPFIHCQEELKETDILFGNLEMVICKNENYSLSSKLDRLLKKSFFSQTRPWANKSKILSIIA